MDRSEEINIVNKFKFRLLTQANYALSQKTKDKEQKHWSTPW